MIYQSAKFWKAADGMIWKALRGDPNHRDLAMGPVTSFKTPRLIDEAYRRSLDWCKSHNLKIDDRVSSS